MLNFLLFDDAKLLCNNRNAKKKHFARLAKRMTIQHVDLLLSNDLDARLLSSS